MLIQRTAIKKLLDQRPEGYWSALKISEDDSLRKPEFFRRSIMSGTLICDIPYEDFVVRMEEFHGFRSPGILLGALMVEAALKEVGTTPYLNMVTETIVCLPDAVQLLTPCTIGNGFLQVLDWGKFALTAYDRKTLTGIRVWLNYDALAGYPEIYGWFERSPKTKKSRSLRSWHVKF